MPDEPREPIVSHEEAALSASGDFRGIEIVPSQEMPADWTPPNMSLGPAPVADSVAPPQESGGAE